MAGLTISPQLRTALLSDPASRTDTVASRVGTYIPPPTDIDGATGEYTRAFSLKSSLPPPKVNVGGNFAGGTGGTGGAPGTGGGSTMAYGYYNDPLSGTNPFGPSGGTYVPGTGSIDGIPCTVLAAFGYPCTTAGAAAAIAAGIRNIVGGGTDPNNKPGAAASCPEGYRVDPDTGMCVTTGVGGTIQRYLPGGKSGTMADAYGEAVVGAFGTPALVPAQVGTITRRDGTTGPVLRCPPGAVLGKDQLCYMKGSIPRQFRKWKPDAKCPISRRDLQAMKAIGRVQKKIKSLASDAGLTRFVARKK